MEQENFTSYKKIAEDKLKKGDYNGAIEYFTKSIEIIPHYAENYYKRAIAKRRIGNRNEALIDCNKAVELAQNLAICYTERAITKEYVGDTIGAEADYTKAIELDSIEIDNYEKRGRLREFSNDFLGAIEDFTKIIELKPNSIDSVYAYSNRANCKKALKDYEGAKEDFKLTLIKFEQINDIFPIEVVIDDIIDVAKCSNNPSSFIEVFTKAIETSPNKYYLHEGLAELYFLIKNHLESLISIEKAISLYINIELKNDLTKVDKWLINLFIKLKTYFDIAKVHIPHAKQEYFENLIIEIEKILPQEKSQNTNKGEYLF